VDATNAIDRVWHDKLFDLLIARKVPAIALRALLDMYQRQSMRTMWNGKYSRLFGTSNGIRQGGVVSPVLFCVYMDALLKRLEDEGYGCWIGNHYFGSMGYADDLKLISPTIQGLKMMNSICEDFGYEYGVQYNPTKTVCILYARNNITEKPTIKLCGTELKWVDTVKHLGNYLDCRLREKTEIVRKNGDLVQRVNNLLVSLGRVPDEVVKKVFNTQCAHFYGAAAWNFNDNSVREFQVMWNRCVRRILKRPYATHTRFLPLIMEISSATDQIYGRFIKMCRAMEKSENCSEFFIPAQ
jgi:hypothetical protein